jgi:signal transduction histidine kinase
MGMPAEGDTSFRKQAGSSADGESLPQRNLRCARLVAILTAILMPAGIVLDLLTNPAEVAHLASLRVGSAAVALLALRLSYISGAERYEFVLGLTPAVAAALAIELMMQRLGGYAHPYYAGLSQCILGLGVIFYWPVRRILFACTLILLIWLVPALVHADQLEMGSFANNLFALTICAAIAVASNGSRYAAMQREIRTRQELATALQRLQQVGEVKSQFFANVTHELRTPLTMILTPLESILAGDFGPLTATQRSYLEANRRNGIRLLKLINDLLDLAKLEEGFLRLKPEATDLRQLVQDVLDYARPMAARKDLTLKCEVRATSSNLFLDLEKMERVLVNLLSNALKFTDRGGVTVTMEASDGEARIAVEDSGIGMSPTYVAHTFDRFSQEDTSITRRFGGTGLGLAYAREIVELHGGYLEVSSERGAGSRFVIHLPEGDNIRETARERRAPAASLATQLKRQDDQEPREWALRLQRQLEYRFAEIDQATDRRLVTRAENAPATAARVLVVEDNQEVLELINLQLRDRYRVYVAVDGKQGLELAQRERPDLIVTDYMMPEMDGLTMLKAVRTDPALFLVPVIMLSARNDFSDRVSAREAGADIYLEKPFSPRELDAAMRQLLGKQGRHIQGVMRAHAEGLETISAGLAHEIHNPLNFIKNANLVIAENVGKLQEVMSQGLEQGRVEQMDKLRQRIERMVESAGRGVARIEKVVEMIRHYAREGFPSEPVELEFDRTVAEVTGFVAPSGEVEASVNLDLSAPGRLVRAIPEELNQVIQSLVQNAVEASGPRGEIKVQTRAKDQEIVFEVSDNGPGISAENVARIFSPFFTTKTGSGRGLGLAIVQVVVARLGGSVDVSSVPHVQTTFRVRLPSSTGQAAPDHGVRPDSNTAA